MDSILVIRTSAIGDVVFASPFAAALRRTYPQAHVAWLVQPSIGSLLEADPNIDEIVPWPQGEWRRLWRGRHWLQLARSVRTFSRELRARRFDLAIDLQGLL